jgi:benzylsuccinate CoA-transferase BbsF subunit
VSNSLADFVAGLHGALMVAAALMMAPQTNAPPTAVPQRTGCWIDLSQYEANVLPAGHLAMAAARGGDGPDRLGNRSRTRTPQGCYRCAGDDAWCALSVGDDAEWERLAGVIGDAALEGPRYTDAAARLQHADLIDERIEAWTRTRAAVDVERALLDARVSAAAVRTNQAALEEMPELVPSYRTMRHAVAGELPVIANPIHFDDGDPGDVRAGPGLGEHTDDVLGRVLGLDAGACHRLRIDGVLV